MYFLCLDPGISLTPLADVFNHKTAVVDLSADYIVNPVCYAASDAELSDDDSDSQSGDLAFGPAMEIPHATDLSATAVVRG